MKNLIKRNPLYEKKNGKIVEATDKELLGLYKGAVRRAYRSFTEFQLAFMMDGGTIVEEKKTNNKLKRHEASTN